jgi:hypothetical protein
VALHEVAPATANVTITTGGDMQAIRDSNFIPASIGTNEDVKALREGDRGVDGVPDSAPMDDKWICGSNNDKSAQVAKLDITVDEKSLTLSGSMLPMMKRWTVTGTDLEGQLITFLVNKQPKVLIASLVVKDDRCINHHFPIVVSFYVCYFPSLANTEHALELYSINVYFDRPTYCVWLPTAFSKPIGIAEKCIQMISFGGE